MIGAEDSVESRTVQLRALYFVLDFDRRRRYAPTVREVAAAVGLTSTKGHTLVTRLKQVGWLADVNGLPRTLHVTETGVAVLTREKVLDPQAGTSSDIGKNPGYGVDRAERIWHT